MRKFFLSFLLLYQLVCLGQNSINSIYTEDVARDFIRIDFENSVGVTPPAVSQFSVNGVTPSAVIMLNDTTVYLKFTADFLPSVNIKMSYSASGGLLGGLPTQNNRMVTNKITNAQVFHWTTSDLANYFGNYTTSFNTDKNIPEGSIIKLAPGDYATVDIAFISDVTFCAEYSTDSVLFTYVNFREKAIHVGLLGHPASGRNVKIRSSYGGFFGMGIYATGRIRLENIEVHHTSQAIQVKTVSDIPSPPYNLSRLNYQALVTKNIYVHDVSEEAFYVGSEVAAPLIPVSWTGYGLVCARIGRDAYQYRNGDWVWLKNCTMNDIGLTHIDSQSSGFLFGTTTQGGYVENISGNNIWGNGIFINGYGDVTIKNCNITSRANTVYIKNYDDHDDYNMKGLTVTITCTDNVFDCSTEVEGYSLDARRDPSKTKITLFINAATTFVNPTYIETNNGIMVHYNNMCDKRNNTVSLKSVGEGGIASNSRQIHGIY